MVKSGVSDGHIIFGGGERDRTDDLLLAKQALSQLSYAPFRTQKSEDRSQKVLASPSVTTGATRLLASVFWLLMSDWWAREDLNLRPHAYQARALTS